jgi:hypothetical protein
MPLHESKRGENFYEWTHQRMDSDFKAFTVEGKKSERSCTAAAYFTGGDHTDQKRTVPA